MSSIKKIMAKHQDSESEVFHVMSSDSQDDLGVLGARLAHHVWISSWQGLRVRSEDMVYVGASLCSGDSYTLNSRVMSIYTHPVSGLLWVCSPAAISQPSLQSRALALAFHWRMKSQRTDLPEVLAVPSWGDSSSSELWDPRVLLLLNARHEFGVS